MTLPLILRLRSVPRAVSTLNILTPAILTLLLITTAPAPLATPASATRGRRLVRTTSRCRHRSPTPVPPIKLAPPKQQQRFRSKISLIKGWFSAMPRPLMRTSYDAVGLTCGVSLRFRKKSLWTEPWTDRHYFFNASITLLYVAMHYNWRNDEQSIRMYL